MRRPGGCAQLRHGAHGGILTRGGIVTRGGVFPRGGIYQGGYGHALPLALSVLVIGAASIAARRGDNHQACWSGLSVKLVGGAERRG